MSPPQLAGDAPVVDVAHPLEIGLRPHLRNEPNLSRLDGADRGLGERADLHEPLRREVRLDDRVAALAVPEREPVGIGAQETILGGQAFHDLLARFEAVEPFVLSGFRGHLSVRADDHDLGQTVAARGSEVVGIVRGGDLDDPGAELFVDEDRVLDDRQLPADDREDRDLAAELRRPRVVRMDRERRVAEHRLGPGRRDDRPRGHAGNVVADPVQQTVRFLVDDLEVGNRGLKHRRPVDQPPR